MLRKRREETKKYKICPKITLKYFCLQKVGAVQKKFVDGIWRVSEVALTLLGHLAGQHIHILPSNPLRIENLLSRRVKLFCTTLP